MVADVFVIGLDEHNRKVLEALPQAQRCRFHQLLSIDELQHADEIPVKELLARAEQQLSDFPGSVDAIIGYWDFPVTLMASVLGERFGTTNPSLESRLACEHKYWSRLVQSEAGDAHPDFAAVEPFDDDVREQIPLERPYWIKPVKSYGSVLAHRVVDEDDLERALADIRSHIRRIGDPFGELLALADDLPEEVARLSSNACIVEKPITGAQCTVEGYAADGEVVVYGVVDSHTLADLPSFERFQYPASVSEHVCRRMGDIARRVIGATGLERSPFNVELFWDADRDEIAVLETNPRHSESHARLFQLVDGCPNHKIMLDLALGEEPHMPTGEGPEEVAAKFFVRHRHDGVVRRMPTREEIAAIEHEVPGVDVRLDVAEGNWLSRLYGQDAYSYKLAHVFVGAGSEAELEERYARCVERLHFEIEPPE